MGDEEEYEKISRPVTAYLTWNTQEAAERCQRNFNKRTSANLKNKQYTELKIFGVEAHLKYSKMPSNIIWENLG